MADEDKRREEMIDFAEKHLTPYQVKVKSRDHTEEIVPRFCPFCHGGDSKDEGTFA